MHNIMHHCMYVLSQLYFTIQGAQQWLGSTVSL